jgi:excisionase family DNA binding protein
MVALATVPNVVQPVAPLAVSKARAATTLGLSVRSIHTLIATGELPAVRVGGRVLIRVDALEAFLASRPAVIAK